MDVPRALPDFCGRQPRGCSRQHRRSPPPAQGNPESAVFEKDDPACVPEGLERPGIQPHTPALRTSWRQAMTTATKETLGFQAEVKQLLNLMVHSLYGNKEIFLRELISNASDAADKLRFEALSGRSLYGPDADLKIRVSFDRKARTVAVSDNGVGMSRDEVVQNIGTIAKSGTREFFQSLTGDQAKDARLIGQFGVGFYSSFIVADRVTLLSRRAGLPADQAVRWHCDMRDGGGEYTVEAAQKEARGTDVVLHLREGEDELLSDRKLKEIIRKYSDHIAIPIVMRKMKWDKEKSEERATDEEETINQ